MVHIITQFYKVKYSNQPKDLIRKRQNEINFCFKHNLEHKDVEKVHFLYESLDDLEFMVSEGFSKDNPKLVINKLGRRMLYSDIFEYANKYLENEICVYLHSDMCIQSGFHLLDKNKISNNNVYMLTSHDAKRCNKKLNCGSGSIKTLKPVWLK